MLHYRHRYLQTGTRQNPLIPITDLRSRVALEVPEAEDAGLHKEADDAVLKARVGLAEAKAKLREDARDELLLGEEAVPTRYG
jgi:hypothetical protein